MKSFTMIAAICLLLVGASVVTADWVSPTDVPYASPDYVSGESYGLGDMYDLIYGSGADGYNGAIMLDDTGSDLPATGHIVFDLGSAKEIDGAKLWSRTVLAEDGNAFPKDVDFFYFDDDDPSDNTLVDDIEGDADIVSLGNQSLTYRVVGDAEEVSFGTSVTKRYLGIRLNESWDPWPTTGERGNHIQEFMVNEVPEPSVVILLVTGMIGLLCYAWRKCK